MALKSEKPSLAEALASARDTRALEIGSHVLRKSPEVFRRVFGARPAVIVADANTLAAAGRAVSEAFQAASYDLLEPFVFSDPNLYAENNFVSELESSLKKHEAIPVAVGSGTINDLTKLAAHRLGRPYMSVATAASMDGYTAFGASITHNGSKQTFLCPAPAAVVADIDVISAAPGDMNAWGYTDLIAKVTAGADWILADALGEEAIHPQAWLIAQGRLRELVADPAGVRAGDRKAITLLVEGLMLGGFAMQAAKSSRAASGAEHQFSHLWDMQHHTHNGKVPSHGFKVGIGTLASCGLYEFLLAQPLETLDVKKCCRKWPGEAASEKTIRSLFGEGELTTVALEEHRAKAVNGVALRAQLEKLRATWPTLKSRLSEQLIPFAELKEKLQAVGAPVEPEQIGISRQRLRDSFLQAYFIRRRFTVLDLAVRAGLLEKSLEQMFGPHGRWPLPEAQA
ncbi:MAG: glycerol-phosphate dehydrogenase [Verrucomicrobiota bacterium]